jgi:outer membrane protein
MKKFCIIITVVCTVLVVYSCKKTDSPSGQASSASGLKVAYVNGDSILLHYEEFRKESEAMDIKQKKAEADLQTKGAALEKEFMAYQQKAQTGTLTPKEMQAREKYLSARQEALMGERDRMAKEIMDETASTNKRLQAVMHEKLNKLKEKEGYDFIFSYVEGGSILVADPKFDITDQVLKELNAEGASAVPADTLGKK